MSHTAASARVGGNRRALREAHIFRERKNCMSVEAVSAAVRCPGRVSDPALTGQEACPSLPSQYIFKERTGGKDRRRYKSSSTFDSGIVS